MNQASKSLNSCLPLVRTRMREVRTVKPHYHCWTSIRETRQHEAKSRGYLKQVHNREPIFDSTNVVVFTALERYRASYGVASVIPYWLECETSRLTQACAILPPKLQVRLSKIRAIALRVNNSGTTTSCRMVMRCASKSYPVHPALKDKSIK